MKSRVLKKRICAYMLLAVFWISQIQFYAPKSKAAFSPIEWSAVSEAQAIVSAYAANSAALAGVNFAASGLSSVAVTEGILSLGDKWAVENGYENLIDWYEKNQPDDNSSLGYKAVWSAGNFVANARLTNQMKLLGNYIKTALFGDNASEDGGTVENPTISNIFSGYSVGNFGVAVTLYADHSSFDKYYFWGKSVEVDLSHTFPPNFHDSSDNTLAWNLENAFYLGTTDLGFSIYFYVIRYNSNGGYHYLHWSIFDDSGNFVKKDSIPFARWLVDSKVYPLVVSPMMSWDFETSQESNGLYLVVGRNANGGLSNPAIGSLTFYDSDSSSYRSPVNMDIPFSSVVDSKFQGQNTNKIVAVPDVDSENNVNFSGNYDVQIAEILGAMGDIEFTLDNTNINLEKIVTQLQQQSADLGGVNTSIADIINAIAGLQVSPGTYETIKTGIETLEEENPEVKPIVINGFPYTLEELIQALQGDDVILTDDDDNVHVVGLPEIIETITETPVPPESQAEIIVRHIIDVGDGVNPGINIDSTPDEQPTPQPSSDPTPIPTVTPDSPTPTPDNPSPTPEQDKLDELGAALTSRFPFSIPWDIVRGIKMLIAPAQAPVFEFDPFAASGVFPEGFAAPIRVDFADFPYVALITRWISTIAFFIALASATKILIWS